MGIQQTLAENALEEGSRKDLVEDKDILLNAIRTNKVLNDSVIFIEKNLTIDSGKESEKFPELKNIYLCEINNTIRVLEKKLKSIQKEPGYDFSLILDHIESLKKKYILIKNITDEELEKEWDSSKLLDELRFILKTCGF